MENIKKGVKVATLIRHALVFDAFHFLPVMQCYLECRANVLGQKSAQTPSQDKALGNHQCQLQPGCKEPAQTKSNIKSCTRKTEECCFTSLFNKNPLLVNTAAPCGVPMWFYHWQLSTSAPFSVGQEQTEPSVITEKWNRLPTTWTLGSRPWAASFIQSLGISHTCSLQILTASQGNSPPWGLAGSGGVTNHLGKPNIYLNLQRGEGAVLPVLPYHWSKTNISKLIP